MDHQIRQMITDQGLELLEDEGRFQFQFVSVPRGLPEESPEQSYMHTSSQLSTSNESHESVERQNPNDTIFIESEDSDDEGIPKSIIIKPIPKIAIKKMSELTATPSNFQTAKITQKKNVPTPMLKKIIDGTLSPSVQQPSKSKNDLSKKAQSVGRKSQEKTESVHHSKKLKITAIKSPTKLEAINPMSSVAHAESLSIPHNSPINSGMLNIQQNQVDNGAHQVISSGPVILNNPGMISINSPVRHYILPKGTMLNSNFSANQLLSKAHYIVPNSSRPNILKSKYKVLKSIKLPASGPNKNQLIGPQISNTTVNSLGEAAALSNRLIKTEMQVQDTTGERLNTYNSAEQYSEVFQVYEAPTMNINTQYSASNSIPTSYQQPLSPFALDFQSLLQQNTAQLPKIVPKATNKQNPMPLKIPPKITYQGGLSQDTVQTNKIFKIIPNTTKNLNQQVDINKVRMSQNNKPVNRRQISSPNMNLTKQTDKNVAKVSQQINIKHIIPSSNLHKKIDKKATTPLQSHPKSHGQNWTYVQLNESYTGEKFLKLDELKSLKGNEDENKLKRKLKSRVKSRFPCFKVQDWIKSTNYGLAEFGFSEEERKGTKCESLLISNLKMLDNRYQIQQQELNKIAQLKKKVAKTYSKNPINYSHMLKLLSDDWYNDNNQSSSSETESAMESDLLDSSTRSFGFEGDDDLLVTSKVVILNNGSEETETRLPKKKKKKPRYMFGKPSRKQKTVSSSVSIPRTNDRLWDYRIYSKISAMKKLHNIRRCYVEIETSELVKRALVSYKKNRQGTVKLTPIDLKMINEEEKRKDKFAKELNQSRMFVNWFNNKIITDLDKFRMSLTPEKPILVVKLDSLNMSELRHYKQFNIVFPVANILPENLPRNKGFIQLVGLGHVKIVNNNVLSEYFKEI